MTRRCLIIRGIATALRLPVDLLWPGLSCIVLQNCSGTELSRWSCGTPNLAPEHQTSAVDRLVNFSGQNGHRSVRREKGGNTQTCK
jgi:hypothetical protein